MAGRLLKLPPIAHQEGHRMTGSPLALWIAAGPAADRAEGDAVLTSVDRARARAGNSADTDPASIRAAGIAAEIVGDATAVVAAGIVGTLAVPITAQAEAGKRAALLRTMGN